MRWFQSALSIAALRHPILIRKFEKKTHQGTLRPKCLWAALAVEEELLGLLLLLGHANPLVDLLVLPVRAVGSFRYNRSPCNMDILQVIFTKSNYYCCNIR